MGRYRVEWGGPCRGPTKVTEDGEVVWGVRGSLKSMGELPSELVDRV